MKAIVKWNGFTAKHYEDLGYPTLKYNEEFEVPIEHLPPTSRALVSVQCPDCGAVRQVQYASLRIMKSHRCRACADAASGKARNKPLTAGQIFSRLTVIQDNGSKAVLCRCECGREKVVDRNGLKAGNIRSCGCARDEYYEDLRIIAARRRNR